MGFKMMSALFQSIHMPPRKPIASTTVKLSKGRLLQISLVLSPWSFISTKIAMPGWCFCTNWRKWFLNPGWPAPLTFHRRIFMESGKRFCIMGSGGLRALVRWLELPSWILSGKLSSRLNLGLSTSEWSRASGLSNSMAVRKIFMAKTSLTGEMIVTEL